MKPTCLKCGGTLMLLRAERSCYAWECGAKCLPPIDTGVPVGTVISHFERDAVREHSLYPAAFAVPLPADRILPAKVFAAQVLYHFIECTWAGCYNSIYQCFLVPHLDSPSAVDYVLRSGVVHQTPDAIVGASGARIYPELLFRLRGVASPRVQQYLRETFPTAL